MEIIVFILFIVLMKMLFNFIVSRLLFSGIINLPDEKKEELIIRVLKSNENDVNLGRAKGKPHFGTSICRIFRYSSPQYDLELRAKYAYIFFTIPIWICGYIVTTPDERILSTVSSETFSKIKKEILS